METNVKSIELKDLWRRYKRDGEERARERLVIAYSPLVKYVSGRMASGLPAHVEESDLISYGLGGLISAIERFELEREIKFETYAITRIKGAIIDELRSLDWVPRSVRGRARSGAGHGRDGSQGPHRRRDRAPARAREARRRPVLLREPDPARDRRGPRRHRVARLAAAHQGRPAPARAHVRREPRRLTAATVSGSPEAGRTTTIARSPRRGA